MEEFQRTPLSVCKVCALPDEPKRAKTERFFYKINYVIRYVTILFKRKTQNFQSKILNLKSKNYI